MRTKKKKINCKTKVSQALALINQNESFVSNISTKILHNQANFTWSRMQSLLLENEVGREEGIKLTSIVIATVKKLFNEISNDIIYFSVKFQNHYNIIDNNFVNNYKSYANKSKVKPLTEDVEFRTYIHNMSMFKLFETILDSYSKENDALVLQMLDLIAFSHLIMKISSADFRFYNMELIKFFQKYNLFKDTDTKNVVICLNFVTNYICNVMDSKSGHCKLIEELTNVEISENSIARSNFRMYKKWKELVEFVRSEIKKELDSLLDCLPKDITVDEVTTDRTNDAIIECFQEKKIKSLEFICSRHKK